MVGRPSVPLWTFLRKTAWPKPNPSAIRFRAGLRSIRKPAKCTSNGSPRTRSRTRPKGCNITQIESFHQVWIAHSPPANASTLTVWDAHLVFDGNIGRTTNGTSATPSFSQTSASNKVMHVGGICTDGIFCSVSGGNRDLADSISITIDRGGSAGLVWTDQGSVLNGPTHITYGCITAGQSALPGAKRGLSCKGPAGP